MRSSWTPYSHEPLQTPDGRELPTRDWAAELGVEFTPSPGFFDADGREVFRTEGYQKAFHIQGALDHVSTGTDCWQPRFQRSLAPLGEALNERGIQLDIME